MFRRVWNWMVGAFVILCAVPALAAPERVAIETSDGMTLAGDLYLTGNQGAPAVVALHMYRSDRSAWAPVAKPLNDAGIDLLAIDMRGHGDSAVQGDVDLSGRVVKRDATLFNDMFKDALAAMDFLVTRGNDPGRIALLGASVGCSVAIDAAVRREQVRGVLLMTPGLNYLGVPTVQHIRDYGTRAMLILSSTLEADVGAKAIKQAVGSCCSVVLFEQQNIHGTRMFGKVEGVERRIADYFKMILGGPTALDGKLSEEEAKGFSLHATLQVGDATLEARAFLRGRYLHAVLSGKPELFPPRFIVAYTGRSMLPEAAAIAVHPGIVATQRLLCREGVFIPVKNRKAPHRAGSAAAKGEVMEILIPLSLLDSGFDPRKGFRLAFALGSLKIEEKLTWFGQAKPEDVSTWLSWPGK